jgi:hypothetical protein
VSYYLEDVDLAGDALHVGLVLDLVLLEDLDGYLLPREDVSAQAYLAESALPEGPAFTG